MLTFCMHGRHGWTSTFPKCAVQCILGNIVSHNAMRLTWPYLDLTIWSALFLFGIFSVNTILKLLRTVHMYANWNMPWGNFLRTKKAARRRREEWRLSSVHGRLSPAAFAPTKLQTLIWTQVMQTDRSDANCTCKKIKIKSLQEKYRKRLRKFK